MDEFDHTDPLAPPPSDSPATVPVVAEDEQPHDEPMPFEQGEPGDQGEWVPEADEAVAKAEEEAA